MTSTLSREVYAEKFDEILSAEISNLHPLIQEQFVSGGGFIEVITDKEDMVVEVSIGSFRVIQLMISWQQLTKSKDTDDFLQRMSEKIANEVRSEIIKVGLEEVKKDE